MWFALAAEVALGVVTLVATRAISSLLVIVVILGVLGGLGFVLRQSGFWPSEENTPVGAPGFRPGSGVGPINLNKGFSTAWNIGNVSFNLSNFPERNDQINQNIPLDADLTSLTASVISSGGLRVVGQEGLHEIQLRATRRVWARDEATARAELDRLQVRSRREGLTLRIEAGDPAQGFVIGRGGRIDLELLMPSALAAHLSTVNGDLVLNAFHGELMARTTVGGLSVTGFNSGRNINLSTTGGKIDLQNVAAGKVGVRAGAGSINLTGVGAEGCELEATAGNVRARGVNCGYYHAYATTGTVELYEAQVEHDLTLKTGAGRLQAENVRATSFQLEAASGAIFYRGSAPEKASQVSSGVGSVQLLFGPEASFNLEAHSNIGSVEVQLPASMVTAQSRNTFQGQIGGGGAVVRVVSQVGLVRVGLG